MEKCLETYIFVPSCFQCTPKYENRHAFMHFLHVVPPFTLHYIMVKGACTIPYS